MALLPDQIATLSIAVIAAEKAFRRRLTSWTVISGAPSCGKSVLLERLAASGQTVVEHPACAILRQDHLACAPDSREGFQDFQARVAGRFVESMRNLDPREPAYFECGLAEPLAYLAIRQMQWDRAMIKLAGQVEFTDVFILEPPAPGEPAHRDAESNLADSTRLELQRCIIEVYTALGQNPVLVPQSPVETRCELVLNRARRQLR
jgi:predicted ATPase